MIDLNEDYFLDNYGKCQRGAGCNCIRTGSVGRNCMYWQPSGCKSVEELIAKAERNRAKDKA